MEKIKFETEDGVLEYFVYDDTRISGRNYLLVADSLDEEAEALILKDVSDDADTEAVYEPVEDEVELMAVAKVFEESLGDVSIE